MTYLRKASEKHGERERGKVLELSLDDHPVNGGQSQYSIRQEASDRFQIGRFQRLYSLLCFLDKKVRNKNVVRYFVLIGGH